MSWLAPPANAAFRHRMKFARERRGLEQREVAAAAGASNAYVCQLESGIIKSPSIDWASAIAKALRVSPPWLAFGDGPDPEWDAEPVVRLDRVYFVSRAGDGAIKIGVSRNPASRLAQLRSGSPEQLTLLAVIPGGRKKERELHNRFAEFRIYGEWFAASAELVGFIATLDREAA
jgi:transcriptional regulator with XRE-family HTH domain